MIVLPAETPEDQRGLTQLVAVMQRTGRLSVEEGVFQRRTKKIAARYGIVSCRLPAFLPPAARVEIAADGITLMADSATWWRGATLMLSVDFAGKSADPFWRIRPGAWLFVHRDAWMRVLGLRPAIDTVRLLYSGASMVMAAHALARARWGGSLDQLRSFQLGMLNKFGAELTAARQARVRTSTALVRWGGPAEALVAEQQPSPLAPAAPEAPTQPQAMPGGGVVGAGAGPVCTPKDPQILQDMRQAAEHFPREFTAGKDAVAGLVVRILSGPDRARRR